MESEDWVRLVKLRRLNRRVQEISETVQQGIELGEPFSLIVNVHLRLEDDAAIQFQIATAILEEAAGLDPEEVVAELLNIGLHFVVERELERSDASQEEKDQKLEMAVQDALGPGASDQPRVLN